MWVPAVPPNLTFKWTTLSFWDILTPDIFTILLFNFFKDFFQCHLDNDFLGPHGLYSLPGSSVHGILQPRILEWVAFPFHRGSFRPVIEPGCPALQADSLPSEPPGKPQEPAISLLPMLLG